MSARDDQDPRGDFQAIGRCPRCGGTIARLALVHDGLLRARSASRGGPYYLLSCEGCGERLVIERSSPSAPYRLRSDRELPPSSPFRRILAEFLGGTARKPSNGTKRAPRPPTPSTTRRTASQTPLRPEPPRWTHEQTEALAVLGLTESASITAVKNAYRALVRRLHPDTHPDATESERQVWAARFTRVVDAYQLLTIRPARGS